MRVRNLLEKIKKELNVESNVELGEKLGVSKQMINNWAYKDEIPRKKAAIIQRMTNKRITIKECLGVGEFK
jgi:DNA-binding transcriptional regulator YiaG